MVDKFQSGVRLAWFRVWLTIFTLITQMCSCETLHCDTFEKVDSLDDKSCKLEHLQTSFEQYSEIVCMYSCSKHFDSTGVFYNADTGACNCCSEHYVTYDGLPTEVGTKYYTIGPDPACIKYLVTGPSGVPDDQLTESGHWCADGWCTGHSDEMSSAKFARLNSTGYLTGAWTAPPHLSEDDFVQVDLLQRKNIVGVVLKGRFRMVDHGGFLIVQYVTSFKVLTSLDCVKYTYIEECGHVKIFEGNVSPEESVIRYLPTRIHARCVRINPVEWFGYKSLRFDVLGC